MAYLKVRDAELWLKSKLSEPWSGENIAPYLTQDLLQEISEKYSTFESQIKVKILLSFLSLKRGALNKVKDKILLVLIAAENDSDEWVSVVYKFVTSYVMEGSLGIDKITSWDNTISKTYQELQEQLKMTKMTVLPHQAYFINQSVFDAIYPNQVEYEKEKNKAINFKKSFKASKIINDFNEICSKAKTEPLTSSTSTLVLGKNNSINSMDMFTGAISRRSSVKRFGASDSDTLFKDTSSNLRRSSSILQQRNSISISKMKSSSVLNSDPCSKGKGTMFLEMSATAAIEQRQKRKKSEYELAEEEEKRRVRRLKEEAEKYQKRKVREEKAVVRAKERERIQNEKDLARAFKEQDKLEQAEKKKEELAKLLSGSSSSGSSSSIQLNTKEKQQQDNLNSNPNSNHPTSVDVKTEEHKPEEAG